MTHSFIVCAYGDSPYLEACIKSLINQIEKSPIAIETSTPSNYITGIANKYNLPVYVNYGESGITQDWNYAYDQMKTDWVTIAHQDDVYLPTYVQELRRKSEGVDQPLIYFSDYGELRNNQPVLENNNLRIKRFLLRKLKKEKNWTNKRVRRSAIAFGNSICCPAVSYYKNNLPHPLFHNHFQSNEDWETWEKLSKKDGAFIYNPIIGMYHRIHKESATSQVIKDNHRSQEDLEMFSKFWPRYFAEILTKLYSMSEQSNNIKE